jgi:hypothetical protein
MKRRIAIILTSGLIFLWQSPCRAESGDCRWHTLYTSKEFDRSDIDKLVKNYKKTSSPDPKLAAQLASFGKAVVPFMDRLACEKKHSFFFMDPNGGWLGIYAYNPYVSHATQVLESLTDPDAIPSLKKMVMERDGGAAQDALVRLGAQFSKEEVISIIETDAKGHVAGYRLKIYANMISRMSADDAASVLIRLFDGKFSAYVHANGSADLNWIAMDNSVIPEWIELVGILGSIDSPVARDVLKRQSETLKSQRSEMLKPVLAQYELALNRKTP